MTDLELLDVLETAKNLRNAPTPDGKVSLAAEIALAETSLAAWQQRLQSIPPGQETAAARQHIGRMVSAWQTYRSTL